MLQSKKPELDEALQTVLTKIDAKTVTCEDFNKLIGKMIIGETSPEAIRDRLRRRTIKNPTDSHIEPETGHQQLDMPNLTKRVQPKIKPRHQQNHGRARIAHKHSARTQAQNHNLNLIQTFEFITKNQGVPITEGLVQLAPDKELLKYAASKLLTDPDIDRDWLYQLVRKLDV